MGGGNSTSKKSNDKQVKKMQKSGSSTVEEMKEAEAASSSVKLRITGQVQRRDFREVYELNKSKQALGTGMTGSVHEWTHKTTGKRVAIKSVKKRGMRPAAIADMKREIALLAQLDHPNIVKIWEAFEDAAAITLVMEICSGGELFDNLCEASMYTQQRAALLFKQMVGSVGYCHKMNVAHRDLKLENFVFESRAEGSQLKLIDFGLSKKYAGGGLKRMKTMVGTSYYMAPEVLDQKVEYGNECDVWSLGVILFMMLTGSPPFDGCNEIAILENVKSNNIHFDEEWGAMPDATDLIRHMLEPDRSKRYACEDVLQSKWLRENCGTTGAQQIISGDVIKSMTKYANMERLKKTAVQVVAFTLSPTEINKLRDQFKVLDADGSGTVSLAEFRAAMEQHGGMDGKSVAELFQKIDSDNTGLISYSEFISASLSTSVELTEDRLCAAFDRLDPDKSGFIDGKELTTLLRGHAKASDIAKMITSADAEGENDGKISKAEFIKCVQQN